MTTINRPTKKRRLIPSRLQVWLMLLIMTMAAGAVAGIYVLINGLSITNLTDLVPWGLWIAVDVSSIALGAGAFMLSAAVYILGLKQYQPVARTAVFVGFLCYSIAMIMLLLDIGRPDRFYYGFIFWNAHSPLWEVTMCIGLYFTVLTLETLPILAGNDFFKGRWPNLVKKVEHLHHYSPILAIAGLGLSMLHQSSLGATYGVLIARPIWYRPGLAVLFIVSAMCAGPALTIFASHLAAALSKKANVNNQLLDQLSRFVGWVLAAYLYLRFWDALSMSYTYEPGRTEALRILTKGSLSANFWLGEMLFGIFVPMVILLNKRLRERVPIRMLGLLLAVGGLIAYRWDTVMVGQMVVSSVLPQELLPRYTQYVPSLIEILAAGGAIAFGLTAFTLGVLYLRIVDHRETEAHPAVSPVLAGTD